jgi:hypothetical protein
MRKAFAVLAICGAVAAATAPSASAQLSLPGLGSLLGGAAGGGGGPLSLFPNPPSCSFSIGFSGIGAGCTPPTPAAQGAAGFLGGLFPNPPSCSAGIGWQGLSGGCVPGSPVPPPGG